MLEIKRGEQTDKVKKDKRLGSDNKGQCHGRLVDMITRGTYGMLIDVSGFSYMDKEMLRKLIVSLIQTGLKYAAVVWSLYKK